MYVKVEGGTGAGRRRPKQREWRCDCNVQQYGYSCANCGARAPKENK